MYRLLLVAIIFLSGCEDISGQESRDKFNEERPADITSEYSLKEGLEGCTVHLVVPKKGINHKYLYVVRCPNSKTTTYRNKGKFGSDSVTVVE